MLGFMTSFAKLLHSITVVNKQCSQKVSTFASPIFFILFHLKTFSSDIRQSEKIRTFAETRLCEKMPKLGFNCLKLSW